MSKHQSAAEGVGPRHCLAVCVNIHCAMNGAHELLEHLVLSHGAAADVVSESGLLVETMYCFGACDDGPNVELDGEAHDAVTPDKLDELLAALD